MQRLAQDGVLVGGEPLAPTGKQVNGKNNMVSNGPFIEAKEMVGGYPIVQAGDINEAVEISKGCRSLTRMGNLRSGRFKKCKHHA